MGRLRFLISAVAVMIVISVAGLARAEERLVPAEPGALASAIAGASPGDILMLAPGRHDGPVVLAFAITLDGGDGAALVQGNGQGSVITVTGTDVILRGLEIRGSGSEHTVESIPASSWTARRGTIVENNLLVENLTGVHVFGARDSIVRGNTIIGRRDHRMNSRGNGIYVWNAPGTLVEGNSVRYGRDGIFANASRDNIYRDNILRDLRFAVHFMYTNNSEITGNASIGNHLGFAIMFSDRVRVIGNMSLSDRDYGVMLNYANNADVSGNLVRGGTTEKCTFVYNAHRNLIVNNRFEGCEIGIHFTAGSERNVIMGNAFIGNQTQVKYVGTRDVEWSHDGRGNFWSDHPAFDLNGDGIADSRFRPNDLMDHILWSQPAAALLLGSPAVQLIRWSQANFPATLPGGVVDSFPLMQPLVIVVPDDVALIEATTRPAWLDGSDDDDESDSLAGH